MSGSTKEIDARGQPCPQPVVLTKKALEEGGFDILEVLVDNESAVENVTRFSERSGHLVESVEASGSASRIRIRRGDSALAASMDSAAAQEVAGGPAGEEAAALPPGIAPGIATVLITAAAIGAGDEELGALLMKGFISTLLETAPLPRRIIFMNGGVRLAVQGSQSLDRLAALAGRGVELLSCGTCLDFYGLKDQLAVGRVTNMYEIASFLMQGAVLRL